MSKPPEEFDEESYLELISVLKGTPDASQLLLKLASAAGGGQLRAAVDKFSFPSCPDNLDCNNCWVSKYCVHQETPDIIRKELLDALQILTSPKMKNNEKILTTIESYDKTDPTSIAIIVGIADHYAHIIRSSNGNTAKE